MNRNIWFQEGTPSSYKIQVLYVDIPAHLKLPKKPVDMPFRFRSYEDAQQAGAEMFPGYEYRIVGSLDSPHWQVPENRISLDGMKEGNWYDVYGVAPVYRGRYEKQRTEEIRKQPQPKQVSELKKLRSAKVPEIPKYNEENSRFPHTPSA